ncbi:MAG: hypothetical protein HC859_12745 [Bacteroidia bacterium]|nr:hypothetical protein [Bacteroidia bacterium]
MVVILWEYQIHPHLEQAFLSWYRSDGTWAQFFAQSDHYLGTEFYRSEDKPNTYVTIDKWRNREAYDAFLSSNAKHYAEFDARCEQFTVKETLIGYYHDAAT